MGRMFDALKQAASIRSHVIEGSTVREDCVVDWSLRESEDVPFIEVGDGKKIEASAQVMAVKHPPQPTVQPPHLVVGKRGEPERAAVSLTESKPLSVSLETWPATSVTSGVAPEVIAHHQPTHPVSQQYAALFTKICEGLPTNSTQAVLLTGAKSHVGASTVLLNLGVVGVENGRRRLVLVDAQRIRPTLAERLGLSVTIGLAEALAGSVALEQAVVKTCIAGLHVLPSRAAEQVETPPTREALAWLLAWLRPRFDMILIDAPAWDESPDAALFAPLCDAVFLVTPRDSTPAAHREAAQSITRQRGRLRGLIHTHLEM